MLNFLKLRLGVKGKIGIYGRSIGNIPANHLMGQVDMVIGDRGMGNLYDTVEKKFHGWMGLEFYKVVTGGWQANNAFNYLKTDKKRPVYKLCLCDKNDEIVGNQISLMTGVAEELCTNKSK